MKKHLVLYLILFILLGCSSRPSESRYGYWDTSKFNLVPNALKDEEEIKVIYSYRGPTGGESTNWYTHIIVVSQKTGDTVNVLQIGYPVEEYDKEEVCNFLGPDNMITKMSGMKQEDISKITHVSQYDSIHLEQRPYVCRDKNFDRIADNKLPTMFGSIGKVTKVNNSEEINKKLNEAFKNE